MPDPLSSPSTRPLPRTPRANGDGSLPVPLAGSAASSAPRFRTLKAPLGDGVRALSPDTASLVHRRERIRRVVIADHRSPPRITHPLVVVMPVYEDVEASTRLFHELATIFGPRVHVVAVDDGSLRQPLSIAAMAAAGLSGTLITLRRNEGHQRALAVGLSYVADHLEASTEFVVTMDSDGEDAPGTIADLVARLRPGNADIVVAERRSRVETLRFRAFYQVYKRAFRLLTGRRIGFGNFMAMTPAAARKLAGMNELWTHVAGCVLASRLRIAGCPLDRGRRYAGRSKLNFVGLALHGFKGLMVFAEDVLVRVGIACAAVAGLSVAGMLAAVVLKVAGLATPGWFSVALGILLLVFLQTGTLTLIMLLLTGVVRGGGAAMRRYQELIAGIAHAEGRQVGR